MTTPWDAVRSTLRAELGTLYEIWIRPVRLLDITGDVVRLEVPNQIFRDWVRDHYARRIGDAFRAELRAPQLQVHFEIADPNGAITVRPSAQARSGRDPQRARAARMADPQVVHTPALPPRVMSHPPGGARALPPPLPPGIGPRTVPPSRATPPQAAPAPRHQTAAGQALGLSRAKRFDTFVVGDCNQFAHAAAEAVADQPGGPSYNPLFIYGGTGLGKTHLMHAIGNRVRQRDPAARILYVTAEQFTNEMIDALRFRQMHTFRDKYRHNTTVLLIDDVQFISGKERTQEELFHTFEWLRERGHQIVFTADVLPREIKGFEPRLRTRCESGMLADMQAPDPETIVAIVHRKASDRGLELGMDAAQYLAARIRGSIREIEGVLNRLLALSSMFGGRPDLEFVRTHLGRTLGDKVLAPEPDSIVKAVASYFEVDADAVLGPRRQRSLVTARHVSMWMCRKHTERSFPELGRFFNRDHTTVQHGVRKIDTDLKRGDAELRRAVQFIEQALV